MADFEFGFFDASLTTGCSLSIALLRTEKTTIDPTTLTYSEPITIAPGGDGAECVLEFHRPADDPPCDPLPWCNPHGYLNRLSFDVMFLGPGKHQCDIEWFIDVDPTERKYRSVPERPRSIKFTFKQATPTAACTFSLITNFYNIPKFGNSTTLGSSSVSSDEGGTASLFRPKVK